MATLPGLRVGLTLDSATFVSETRRVEASVNRLGRNIAAQSSIAQRGLAGITAAARGLAIGLASAVGAASIGGLVRLGKSALDTAGNLGEMAQQAGVTTRQLQILTVAGLQVGVSQEQLITSMAQFGRRVGEAAQGTGDLRNTLAQYNIAVKTAEGGTRASVDVLGDLAEAVQNAASSQEKLRIASDAFGSRIGSRLVPLLNEGREGFQRWAEEAQKTGLIMSDDLVSQADRASDSIATLQHALGAGFNIGVVESFASSVTTGADALRQAREAGEAFGKAVGTGLRAATAAIKFVVQHFRELAAVASFFIGLKLASIVLSLAGAMFEFAKAIRAAAVAHELLNFVTLKGKVFITLLAAVLAAGVAYQALGGEIKDVTNTVEGFFERVTGGGLAVLSADAEKAAEKLADLKKEMNATLAEQRVLNEGLGGGSGAVTIASLEAQKKLVEDINRDIEIANEIRRSGVSAQDAANAGLFEQAKLTKGLVAENQKLTSVLTARVGFKDETEQIQLLLDHQLVETQEYRKQLELLKLKQQYGVDIAATAELEADALAKVTQAQKQAQAARDIEDQIKKQQILISHQGKETEEYRKQVRILDLRREGVEITPELRKQIDLTEQLTTQLEAQAKTANLIEQTFVNALENIQRSFADTFEEIFSGGVTSFSDLAGEIKRIFIRLAAEIAALMVIRPVLASAAGAAGISGFAGAAGAAPSLASQLGQTAPVITTPNALGFLPGGQVQSGGGVPVGLLGSTGFLGSNITGGQALLAGGLGAAGGSIIGGFAGSSTGGSIGGGLGATAGALIGSVVPGIGTVAGGIVGGLVGSFAGGFLGGLFGGGSTGREATIGGAGLGALGGGGKAAQFAQEFDKKLIGILNERQREIADRMLKGAAGVSVKFQEDLSAGDISRLAAGRIAPVARGLGFRESAIAGEGRTPEEQLSKLVEALNVQQQVKDLVSGFGQFARQARDLRRQFDELRESAKEFGISTRGMREAQREAGFDLIRQQLANLGGGSNSFRDQLDALRKQFADVKKAAGEFGFSISEVRQAAKQATDALKEQQRAQVNALALNVVAPFEQLLAPLEAFQQQLKFADLNPLQQFEIAAQDFRRIAELARAGSTIAIGQLQGAGELFVRLAEQVGASPGGVAARAEVSGVTESVMKDLKRAQQDAQRGIETEIQKAARLQVDTLKELIQVGRDTVAEIKKLRRT